MSEWIKVEDALPKVNGDSILGWNGWGVSLLSYRSHTTAKTEKGRKPRFENWNGIASRITHWMSLPEPPTE